VFYAAKRLLSKTDEPPHFRWEIGLRGRSVLIGIAAFVLFAPMKLGRIGMPKGRTRMGTMTRIHRRATGSASATEATSRASHPTEGDIRKR
jgi:hypothetical protein